MSRRLAMVPVGARCSVCDGWFVDETPCPRCDDYPDPTEADLVAYLRDRPAVWLAVHRAMPQAVLGPWQANDRSTPPVPEDVMRVRYGHREVSVVWDRGPSYIVRWRWRCGFGVGDAATRDAAEAAADQHARDRGVLLVDEAAAEVDQAAGAGQAGSAP